MLPHFFRASLTAVRKFSMEAVAVTVKPSTSDGLSSKKETAGERDTLDLRQDLRAVCFFDRWILVKKCITVSSGLVVMQTAECLSVEIVIPVLMSVIMEQLYNFGGNRMESFGTASRSETNFSHECSLAIKDK